jgi:hypothetical protein
MEKPRTIKSLASVTLFYYRKTSINFKIIAAEVNEPAQILTYLPRNVAAVFGPSCFPHFFTWKVVLIPFFGLSFFR